MRLLVFIMLIALIAGCQPAVKDGSPNDKIQDFPEQMVGIWESEPERRFGAKWGIKFEPDGSVIKIIHYVAGPVDLRQGGTLIPGKTEDTFFDFQLAPVEVEYSAETKELSVHISVTSYFMQMPIGNLEGTIDDYFTGPVSKDGLTWKVERRTYSTLEGTEETPKEVIDANPEILMFRKAYLEEMSNQ